MDCMYKTTKSPRTVLVVVYRVALECLAAYSHRFSPRKFTQHQLFAILVLKEFLRCDYRKIVALLRDCPDLGRAIDLRHVPHFTTVQKAARRLLRLGSARRLLATTLAQARKKSCAPNA